MVPGLEGFSYVRAHPIYRNGRCTGKPRRSYAHPSTSERNAVEIRGGILRREGNMQRQQPATAINDRLEGWRDLLLHDGGGLMELQTPDEGREDDLELKHREAVPNAVARPVAESDEPAPPMGQCAGRGHAPGYKPARRVERGRLGAPDFRVDVHRRERDVEDLTGANADRTERLARGGRNGLRKRDDVVAEGDALSLGRGGVEAETTRGLSGTAGDRRGKGKGALRTPP